MLLVVGCGGAEVAPTVGTVDMQRALTGTHGGAAARAHLQQMFVQRQAALDQQQTALTAERATIDARRAQGQDVGADEARYGAELSALQAEFQAFQRELDGAEQAATQEIIARMSGLVEELRAARGLDVVIERNEGGVVATSSRVVDLTDALMTLYDQRFPVPPEWSQPLR